MKNAAFLFAVSLLAGLLAPCRVCAAPEFLLRYRPTDGWVQYRESSLLCSRVTTAGGTHERVSRGQRDLRQRALPAASGLALQIDQGALFLDGIRVPARPAPPVAFEITHRGTDRSMRAGADLGLILPEEPVRVGSRWTWRPRAGAGPGASEIQYVLRGLEPFQGRPCLVIHATGAGKGHHAATGASWSLLTRATIRFDAEAGVVRGCEAEMTVGRGSPTARPGGHLWSVVREVRRLRVVDRVDAGRMRAQ